MEKTISKLVWKSIRSGLLPIHESEDASSHCMLAAIEATKFFDSLRKVSLNTYLYVCIKNALIDYQKSILKRKTEVIRETEEKEEQKESEEKDSEEKRKLELRIGLQLLSYVAKDLVRRTLELSDNKRTKSILREVETEMRKTYHKRKIQKAIKEVRELLRSLDEDY